ncbi:MAG: hypothetical protein HFJ36_04750 [Clostridia bacterium]|nr:hypothetical protein [Clostridia bacterium]
MKFFTKKTTVRKIIVVCIILLLVNFSLVPYASYAAEDDDWIIGGALAKEVMKLLQWFGDVIMGMLNNFMLGANTGFGGFGSAMLPKDDNPNLENPESWLYAEGKPVDYKFEADEIDTSRLGLSSKYEIPNMLYAPENIFSNNIAALDVNFLRPNTYSSVYGGGDDKFSDAASEASESGATKIRDTVANWYKSFRNIAVVALLSILIYLGIRILIGSTAEDKAKYKEAIKDWVVALCLVFFMQFIMSATLMVCDQITGLFSKEINEGYVVQVGDDAPFKTNLMGLVRFRAQSKKVGEVAAYTIIYGILVVYTCTFTFMYYKRLLYMAFFTMISPLVAVTYPIDRYGDRKSTSFKYGTKRIRRKCCYATSSLNCI